MKAKITFWVISHFHKHYLDNNPNTIDERTYYYEKIKTTIKKYIPFLKVLFEGSLTLVSNYH